MEKKVHVDYWQNRHPSASKPSAWDIAMHQLKGKRCRNGKGSVQQIPEHVEQEARGECKELTLQQAIAEAAKQGLRVFDYPIPCINGHIGLRYTVNGSCVVCIRSRATEQRSLRTKRRKDEESKDLSARQEAISTGALTYKSNLPCLRGHMSERYTKSACCVECKRLETERRSKKFKVEQEKKNVV